MQGVACLCYGRGCRSMMRTDGSLSVSSHRLQGCRDIHRTRMFRSMFLNDVYSSWCAEQQYRREWMKFSMSNHVPIISDPQEEYMAKD